MKIISKVRAYITGGGNRSSAAKKNIIYMMFIKVGSIIANLLLVPLTLHYVDSATYGIWLTLSSMVAWVSFFDIGLNQGLKNRLAEALAHNDIGLGKVYVSTTYAMLSIIFIPLMVLLLVLVPSLDWSAILKIDCNVEGLSVAISIIVFYFCINFILSTINVVFEAYQKPAGASLRNLVQQLSTIALVYLFTLISEGSLVNLCIALCVAPLLVVSFFNITLFRGKYKGISPSVKSVDFSKIPDLFSLGIKFFVIQLAGIIQFQMINFLIIRNYGADDVTRYNIATKYFGIIFMAWNIILTPLWAAVTDAMAKNEIEWVRNAKIKYLKLFCPFAIVAVLMLPFSPYAYDIWLGGAVEIPFKLSFWVMLYYLTQMFGSTYVFILNGAGCLKVQSIVCAISPFVFLFVTFLLIKNGCDLSSIIVGSIIANFNGYLVAPIQCHNLLKKRNTQYER